MWSNLLGIIIIGLLGTIYGEDCYTPSNYGGYCMNFKNCPFAVQNQKLPEWENYLRRSICGFNGLELMICCPATLPLVTPFPITQPQPPPQPQPQPQLIFYSLSLFGVTPSPIYVTEPPTNIVNGRYVLPTYDSNKCGISNGSHTRVVGGNNAQLNAWPWIAALGYRSSADSFPRYLCGGTLITQRHVITAAHCIKESLYVARLGEHDMNSDSDGANPIDVSVESKIAHEQYDSKTVTNDIGMIKLSAIVPYTNQIRPICLPFAEPLRSKDYTYYQPFVAGWGATVYKGPPSSILQEVQLPIIPLTDCSNSYRAYFPLQVFDDRVMCAGYLAGGTDSCQGDSGGPLMLPQISSDGLTFYFNLIGIVSYGYECARPGFPGVYTRITTFIPWIENHLND